MCSPVQRSSAVALFSELRRPIFSGELIFIRTSFTNIFLCVFGTAAFLQRVKRNAAKDRWVEGRATASLLTHPNL